MSEQVMISRELLGRILNCMESDWMKIDMEWGPSEGGLDGEIEKGLYPEIKELRAYVQAIPPPASAQHAGEVQWPNADEIMQMAFEEGHPADDASGYYFELEEFDLFIERLMSDVARLNAAPVQQAEYGDAYQGAREDLAIWKRRALEAEEKVLQQEQIIDHLTSEAQGESRFGEPVVTPDAPCVPDGYVLADKKALGTVLQALVNAPHHIRELQVTRQPVELFSDNPINVLIANYEAPASPAAPAADASDVLEQAMYALIGIGYHENSGLVHELRQSLAAHRAKGVV